MHEALLPFADIIRAGEVPNYKIAKMAKHDVVAADVEAARAELLAADAPKGEGEAPKPEPKPEADEKPAAPVLGAVADVAHVVEVVAEAIAAAVPVAAPVAEVVAAVADAVGDAAEAAIPSHVRMKRTVRAPGPDRRTRHYGYGGIYKGDVAAWLWTNHRASVEPFDPTPRKSR